MEFFTFILTLSLLIGRIKCVDDNTGAEEEKRAEVDTKSLNLDNLNSIFNALEAYGPTKKPSNQSKARQFTSTTVLAEEEINNITWLRNGQKLEFPDDFKTDDRRIRVQYNERRGKHHGEKILLEKYLGKLIEEMKKDSKAKKMNTYPVVVLYSFYIPCSIGNHVCAQRLINDSKTREYSLVVGYSEYFIYQQWHNNSKNLTIKNIQDSFNTLREGAVAVYYMMQDFSGRFSVMVTQDNFSDIFQTNLYSCLIKQPLAYCCSANLNQDAANALADASRIVTFSINSMVYACKANLTITRFLAKELYTCYDTWIDNNIGPDCQTCASGSFGQKVLIDYTKSCFRQTWEFSQYVGALEDPRRLDNSNWKHGPISWIVTPACFRITNALHCYNRSLRPDSLCTKTETLDYMGRLKKWLRQTKVLMALGDVICRTMQYSNNIYTYLLSGLKSR